MITKQTAFDIWTAYDEIEKGQKLLAQMEEQKARGQGADLRDVFGRPRPLSLGIPSGENSQRLLDVAPELAVEVIKAHIANKQTALKVIQERAGAELSAYFWANEKTTNFPVADGGMS